MSLVLMQAVTPLMVGEGTTIGSTNMVLARERHTRWPFIPGSSMKGALRARAVRLGLETELVVSLFGSEPGDLDDGEARRGSVAFHQATLLALPLRSLAGTFVLATSPLALSRLARELGSPTDLAVPSVDEDRALVAPGAGKGLAYPVQNLMFDDSAVGIIMLEDLDWILTESRALEPWIEWLGAWGGDVPWERLVVLNDALFDHACAAWVPVRTRAAIGEDGIVEQGKLFTQESLPPETLLWTNLDAPLPEREHLDPKTLLPRQGDAWTVGGHQTTGAGRVVWYAREAR